MLATRPFLLHTARIKLQRPETRSTHHNLPSLETFCTACTEAAWKTLQILQSLREQGIIGDLLPTPSSSSAVAKSRPAKFGFFDLDALFSAAFVFVLAEKITPRQSAEPSGIRGAASLMDWLSTCGNKVASKRLEDIHQMCSHLGIDVDWQGLGVTPKPAVEGVPTEAVATEAPTLGGQGSTQDVMPAWQPADPGHDLSFDMLSFSPGELGVTSFWDGGGLSLDGTFETDWQEFERITSQF